jgi:hypothetical protein
MVGLGAPWPYGSDVLFVIPRGWAVLACLLAYAWIHGTIRGRWEPSVVLFIPGAALTVVLLLWPRCCFVSLGAYLSLAIVWHLAFRAKEARAESARWAVLRSKARGLTTQPRTEGLGWDVLVDLCEQDGRFAEAYGAMLRSWRCDPDDADKLKRLDRLRAAAKV